MGALSLTINPMHPEPQKIRRAAEILAKGGIAFYPTDTVYALGCAFAARRSIDRLYRLKRMDARQPLAMICADLGDIARYAIVSKSAYRLMRRLLPGPYTFVLTASPDVPRLLIPTKRRTVGIRVPDNAICAALVRELGQPLLTTSAIPPGHERAASDVAEGKAAWPSGVELFIDGGLLPIELSTVVSLADDEVEILREGLGPIGDII